MVDHSRTYTDGSLRNLPHRRRLRGIDRALDRVGSQAVRYADFGCSDGFLTHRVAGRLSAPDARGFDRSAKHVGAANERYPSLAFDVHDLECGAGPLTGGFDVVTCFETLEHVGDPQRALDTLLDTLSEGGRLLITVPVQTGLYGLAKLVVKRLLGDGLDELPERPARGLRYAATLATGRRTSAFRSERRPSWSTHCGFDWRDIDDRLLASDASFTAWNEWGTRFYLVESPTRERPVTGDASSPRP